MKKNAILKSGFAKQREQMELRKQYHIEKELVEVKVISRTEQVLNLLWKIVKSAIKVMGWIALAWLALMGLAALVYPNIRAELIGTALQTVNELKNLIGV